MSTEQIQELRDAIQRGLDSLPAKSAFGGSNAHDRRLMQGWLADLDRVLAGQEPQNEAVASWISGDDDWFLNDFLS